MHPARLALGAFLVLLLPEKASAQVRAEADTAPRIVVTVTRSMRVVPDRATFFVTLEGSAETPADALKRVQQKLDAVLTAVRALGGRVEAAVPIPYGIAPAPNQSGYPQMPAALPYVARYALRITPRRLEQIREIAATAIAAGALSSSAPQFEASATDSVRRALIAEAIQQAQREADAVAESLGGRRGTLVDLTVGSNPSFGFQSSTISFSSRFDMGGPTNAPEVQVVTNVTARYRLMR